LLLNINILSQSNYKISKENSDYLEIGTAT